MALPTSRAPRSWKAPRCDRYATRRGTSAPSLAPARLAATLRLAPRAIPRAYPADEFSSRPRGRKNRAWSASMVGADRIGIRRGRTTKILISALLIVLGDRVDVQPDIASRVRHGRYGKAVSGGHPAIVENPGPRFRIVVINREPRIPLRRILKADGPGLQAAAPERPARTPKVPRSNSPCSGSWHFPPDSERRRSTPCLQDLDIRRDRQSLRRRKAWSCTEILVVAAALYLLSVPAPVLLSIPMMRIVARLVAQVRPSVTRRLHGAITTTTVGWLHK
jgi:hypothetical protein